MQNLCVKNPFLKNNKFDTIIGFSLEFKFMQL